MVHSKKWIIAAIFLLLVCAAPRLRANDDIPQAAWKRPLGATLENPGKKKAGLEAEHLDDGYWQGAPVGGFGAGSFSRSYRGDFVRWHIKGGVHKYETVPGNQFAMFQKADGDAVGVARVLMNGHPQPPTLSAWQWDYPEGAGDYYALYPKSWFDYKWEKFPAHVTLEQFSPILPNNYKETSYPVAVYRWHAENPTNKRVTVAVMLSWENMIGWFRTYRHDLSDAMNEGNFNRMKSEPLGPNETMQGIVLDRNHIGKITEEWDGQFAIASVVEPGVELSYQTTFSPDGSGEEDLEAICAGRQAGEQQGFVDEQRRADCGSDSTAIHAGARREEDCADGHRVGLTGGGVWFRAEMVSALYGLLRHERTECVDDGEGCAEERERVERGD